MREDPHAMDELTALIKYIGVPLCVKDNGGSYVMVNEAYCELLGASADQLLNDAGAEFFSEGQIQELAAQDERVLRTGDPDVREMEVQKEGASDIVALSVVKTLFTDKAGERLVVGIFRDITAQKRTERELQKTAKLKADLSALIDHEYADVLADLKLALALLGALDPWTPEEARRHACEVLGRTIEKMRAATAGFLSRHRLARKEG
jgi:PAS domain S-box-containing protein